MSDSTLDFLGRRLIVCWKIIPPAGSRSRMFMRAVLSEEARVGLLLFDEPSAALDPAAERGTAFSYSSIPFWKPDWSSQQTCSRGYES